MTSDQQHDLCAILSVGCDRQTAVDFIGCSLAALRSAMRNDPYLTARMRRAEAGAEIAHMTNIKEAALAKKDWRISAWWLESHAPERFARRAGSITTRQVRTFIAILNDVLQEILVRPEDRERLVARLRSLSADVESLLHGDATNVIDLTEQFGSPAPPIFGAGDDSTGEPSAEDETAAEHS
jgi:hypothetical protein